MFNFYTCDPYFLQYMATCFPFFPHAFDQFSTTATNITGNSLQSRINSPFKAPNLMQIKTVNDQRELQVPVIQKKSPRGRKPKLHSNKTEAGGQEDIYECMLSQKEGKNSLSNLLRMFFRRLQIKLENGDPIFQKIIRKYNLQITTQRFSMWLESKAINHKNYIRLAKVSKMFMGGKINFEHSKMLRILLAEFVNKEALCCYLTSRKTKRDLMVYNGLSMRMIYKQLANATDKNTGVI